MKSGDVSPLLRELLSRRGYETDEQIEDFLNPDFAKTCYDPNLFEGMHEAVSRICAAKKRSEKITIYGDYDIDGMTATVILWESLRCFGLDCDTYTPDRFTEGYGLNKDAISQIAEAGAKLIITVDNGTLSFDEIDFAKTLGVDVIITDHHTPHFADENNAKLHLPNAVAVINPKLQPALNPEKYDGKFRSKKEFREEKLYPFCDPCGAGTAFILVRALQKESLKTSEKFAKSPGKYLIPLADGQEKWLLDLVALGTVCDIVGLVDENRNNVKWGIEVMKRTRRPGIRALLAVAGVKISEVNSETLGFVLGPRLNAAGRMETAEYALELLKLHDVSTAGFSRKIGSNGLEEEAKTEADVNSRALELATKLDLLNKNRRKIQDNVFVKASQKIEENFRENSVLVVDGDNWHEGIIGIVAAKILEKYSKPTIVLARGEDGFAKGSGRSFGEFSMAAVIHASDKIIERGGGHLAAGGLTVKNEKIKEFRENVQIFYSGLNLENQEKWLVPEADLALENFSEINQNLLDQIEKMQPFGHANESPVVEFKNLKIVARRLMGQDKSHVKYTFADKKGRQFQAIAFSSADKYRLETYDENGGENRVNIRVNLAKNEWNGRVSVEGRLLFMEKV